MKKVILPAILGALITVGSLAAVYSAGFCPCGPSCACSPCNCNK